MKANELMIGDWVLVNGNPMQIQAIDDIDGEIMAGDELYCLIEDRVHSEDKVEPIPLTVEILEKNVFEVQDQGGGRKDVWRGFGPDCEGDIEIEFNNGVPTHLKIDGAFKGEYYTSTNIKSVHKLQHALKLCGIDKEIVL